MTRLIGNMGDAARDALAADSDVTLAEIEGAGQQDVVSASQLRKTKKLLKKSDHALYCSWCRKSKGSSEFHLRPPVQSKADILTAVPPGATIVHVIDGNDFPTTLDIDLTKPSHQKVVYVVTKTDLVAVDRSRYKLARDYFAHVLSQYGVPRGRVIAVDLKTPNRSASALNELLNLMGADNYLVGSAGAGKTTLALQLAHRLGARLEPDWKNAVWANPWTTQLPRTFKLKHGSKHMLLTDLMSYPEPHAAFYYVKPKFVRALLSGTNHFAPPYAYAPKRLVASRPSQLISIGGVVAFRCQDATLIGWPIVAKSTQIARIVRDVDRVREINASTLDEHADWSIVRPEHADQDLHLAKTFRVDRAGTTVALRGIGLVHFHINGRIPPGGATVEAFALPDVDLHLTERPNILPYIAIKNRAPDQRIRFLTSTILSRFLKRHPEHAPFMNEARVAYAAGNWNTLRKMLPVRDVHALAAAPGAPGHPTPEAQAAWKLVKRDLIESFGSKILH